MKKVLLEWLPGTVRASLREWRDLPEPARSAWTRMLWQRTLGRDITELPPDLAQLPRVLFLCHGNIYRSPAAEVAFAEEARRRGFPIGSVASAGVRASPNRSAPADAVAAAAAIGVDLRDHRSTFLSADVLAESDLVVIMDRRNQALLAELSTEALNRAVLLGAFDPEHGAEDPVIDDPYGQGDDAVAACYARIERSVRGMLDALAASTSPGQVGRRSALRTRAKHAVRRNLTSAPWLSLWDRSRQDAASVLMLHRFSNPDLGIIGHCPEQLASNLEYLRRHRFHICSLEQLTTRLAAGLPPLPNTVVFTVDDGYADFAEVGAPVFARFDVPATVFLITSGVDERRWVWYDVLRYCAVQHLTARIEVPIGEDRMVLAWRNSGERRRAIRQLIAQLHRCPTDVVEAVAAGFPDLLGTALPEQPTPRFALMNWDDVRHWEERGMQFGPHTDRHPILSRSTAERAREEIEISWRKVRERTLRPVSTLCFPSGMREDVTARDRAIAREAGLTSALIAYGGRVTGAARPDTLFSIPRLAYDSVPALFRWQVGGWVPKFREVAE